MLRTAITAWLGLALTACPADSKAPKPPPTPVNGSGSGSGSGSAAHNFAAEQTRFDRERRPEFVIDALALSPGDVVADVGAGSGLLTVHLARAVGDTGKVVATDIDGAVLDLLKQRLDAAGLVARVEPRVVGSDEPGLEPGRYDAILLAEVDHYFPDRVGWLRAARLALKPDGRTVITNRIHHRQAAVEAAEKAGLKVASFTTPIPSHFVLVLTPAP